MADSQPKHLAPGSKARRHPIVIILVGLAVVAGLVIAETYARPYLASFYHQVLDSQQTPGTTETPAATDTIAAQADGARGETGDDATDDATTQGAEEAEGEPVEEPPAEPVTIEAMMIGDILMHDALVQSGAQEDGSYNYDFIYEHIRPYIDAADMRILNQETVMGLPESGYYMTNGAMGPIMNTPTALADSEMRFGFNVVLNAHNHIFDQGYEGLAHEMDYWHDNYPQVPIVGVNNPHLPEGDQSQNLVDNVYIYEKDGFKIAILNHTYDTNEHPNYETDSKYCSYMTEEKVRADVQKARDLGADLIVACPHWGVQYTTEPSDEEWTFSKLYTELGVDLIFGCHPHILQHVEMLRNAEGHKTVCYYSMGNYVASLRACKSAADVGKVVAVMCENEPMLFEERAAKAEFIETLLPFLTAVEKGKGIDNLRIQIFNACQERKRSLRIK